MPFKHLKSTPKWGRIYLLFAALLIALPSILSLYKGHTGKFLVSTGRMSKGSIFHETVIYLEHHDFGGAHGVIINKPVPSREFREPFPELEWKVNLYKGGPVLYGERNFILLPDEASPNKIQIAAIESFREQRPDLAAVLDQKKNEDPMKFFVGYAGWAALQLNNEIRRGSWGVIDYDPVLMFETPVEEIWDKAIERVLETRPAARGGV